MQDYLTHARSKWARICWVDGVARPGRACGNQPRAEEINDDMDGHHIKGNSERAGGVNSRSIDVLAFTPQSLMMGPDGVGRGMHAGHRAWALAWLGAKMYIETCTSCRADGRGVGRSLASVGPRGTYPKNGNVGLGIRTYPKITLGRRLACMLK